MIIEMQSVGQNQSLPSNRVPQNSSKIASLDTLQLGPCFLSRESDISAVAIQSLTEPMSTLSVKTPLWCQDYCRLTQSCLSYSHNLLNGICSLFNKTLSDSSLVLEPATRYILWGDKVCFMRPETILSLEEVLETNPVMIRTEAGFDLCLKVAADGIRLKWDKCASADAWLISYHVGNGSDSLVQIALASDPSLCIRSFTPDSASNSIAKLSTCNDTINSEAHPKLFMVTFVPHPHSEREYEVYRIFDPESNYYFDILFLSKGWDLPGLDSVVFFYPPKKPRVCRLRDIRAVNGQIQNEKNVAFFLEGHVIMIECKEGYGVFNGSYILPTQTVKCNGEVAVAEPCRRLSNQKGEGYCDLYLVLAVALALFLVIAVIFLILLTVQYRKLSQVVVYHCFLAWTFITNKNMFTGPPQ